jgi:creatinine amidohydrolase
MSTIDQLTEGGGMHEDPRRVLMAEMTWPEYRERLPDAVVILPVGSTEQHGPHLPLGSDALTVGEIARRVAERIDGIVAPTIPYGYRSAPRSGGGEIFVGTTSLTGQTLILVARDVLTALVRHGARKIVVLDGHYENNMFLHEAIHLVLDAGPPPDLRIMKILWVDPIGQETLDRAWPDGFPGWALEHAAHLETSVFLSMRPDLVRRDAIGPDGVTSVPVYDMYPQPIGLVPSSGVLSDPSRSTAGSGELLLRESVDGLVAAIEHEFGGA